jgi:hypothetical protein
VNILAIDPGTTESGVARYAGGVVVDSGVVPNADLVWILQNMGPSKSVLAIEWIESYGMPVGREVFETVRWIGRFQQAWHDPIGVLFVPRREVKLALCGNVRAKDANIRQALLDRVGAPGTKAKPGPTYGVKSHAWSALAVAVTVEARRHA